MLQIYLVSHQSNMQFICAFAVVDCFNQMYGIIKAVFVRDGIHHEKSVGPFDVFINLRRIALETREQDIRARKEKIP